MALEAETPPLLALSLELRRKIYEQLLSPNPDRVYTLYHDRLGRIPLTGREPYTRARRRRHGYAISRDSDCCIDPAILRVNHQIYCEAVSILYENNEYLIYLATPVVFQCTGGSYPDDMVNPAGLFRSDTNETVTMTSGADPCAPDSPFQSLDTKEQLEPSRPGIIYPHCFRRLRRINLISARGAIWGGTQDGAYFSHIGRTIWKILNVLAEEKGTESPLKKHLTFTIEGHWLRDRDGSHGMQNEINKETKPILGMMKALQRKIEIEIKVEEETFTKSLKELPMEEAEVNIWEQTLLAGMKDTNERLRIESMISTFYECLNY